MRNRRQVSGVRRVATMALLLALSVLLTACAGNGDVRSPVTSPAAPLEISLIQLEALDYLELGQEAGLAASELRGRFEVIVGIRNTTAAELLLDTRLLAEARLLQCFDQDGEYVMMATVEPSGPFDAERHTVPLAAGETMWLRRDLGALIWIPNVDDDSPLYVKAQYGPRRHDTPDAAFPGYAGSELQRIVVPRQASAE
jgi:hypothetical protein